MSNEADEPQKVEFKTPLEAYQAYIDSLPDWLHTSVKARWVREWDNKPASSVHQPSEAFSALMRRFDAEQRQIIASLLEEERHSSIFDWFHWLNDQLAVGGLKLMFHNVELPVEPYGETLYMDWMWRLSGEAWPVEGRDWQDAVDTAQEE